MLHCRAFPIYTRLKKRKIWLSGKYLTFKTNGGPIFDSKIVFGHLNDLFRQIGPLRAPWIIKNIVGRKNLSLPQGIISCHKALFPGPTNYFFQRIDCFLLYINTLKKINNYLYSHQKIRLLRERRNYRQNTSLAAKGALANRLQRRTACKIQNGRQGAPKWQRGSGKVSTPRFLGVLSNFR